MWVAPHSFPYLQEVKHKILNQRVRRPAHTTVPFTSLTAPPPGKKSLQSKRKYLMNSFQISPAVGWIKLLMGSEGSWTQNRAAIDCTDREIQRKVWDAKSLIITQWQQMRTQWKKPLRKDVIMFHCWIWSGNVKLDMEMWQKSRYFSTFLLKSLTRSGHGDELAETLLDSEKKEVTLPSPLPGSLWETEGMTGRRRGRGGGVW